MPCLVGTNSNELLMILFMLSFDNISTLWTVSMTCVAKYVLYCQSLILTSANHYITLHASSYIFVSVKAFQLLIQMVLWQTLQISRVSKSICSFIFFPHSTYRGTPLILHMKISLLVVSTITEPEKKMLSSLALEGAFWSLRKQR